MLTLSRIRFKIKAFQDIRVQMWSRGGGKQKLSHLGPAVVVLQAVHGQGDHFHAALTEL